MQDIRDEIQKQLRWSFFGPDNSAEEREKALLNEIEREDPNKRYITGILSPQLNISDDEESKDDTPFSKTGVSDSSFGFTFCLPNSYKGALTIGANFSTYNRIKREGVEVFIRQPFEPSFDLLFSDIKENSKKEFSLTKVGPNPDEIKLVLTRRTDVKNNDGVVYTLSIVHLGKEDSGLRPWRSTLYHVELWAKYASGDFMHLPYESLDLTEDKRLASLLYRNIHRYAVGHGCGANWDTEPVGEIRSTFFPDVEVPVFKHKDIATLSISMKHWASGAKDYDILNDIGSGYSDWLLGQVDISLDLTDEQKVLFEKNKKSVEKTVDRINSGIALLKSNEDVQFAFQWMNQAILTQQITSKLKSKPSFDGAAVINGSYVGFDVLKESSWPVENSSKYGKWRLFQMAFILMCLPDIVSNNKPAPMDLIWFPTGGGKTEAYLGVSAFLLLYERIAKQQSFGVRIIMRYTLRLLTAQQFERAASIILALDDIRKENVAKLGERSYSIGLWVGGSVSFNKHGMPSGNWHKTVFNSNNWFDNLDYRYHNKPWPWVLQKCPRCAREFGVKEVNDKKLVYGVKRADNDKIIFSCHCSTYEDKKLPIYIVDEDIYKELPSMVIGTVDKFTRLSWLPESSKILGVNAISRGKHSPISLIIQDELHLLEGPLGTITGLYEAAIDYLIERTGGSPKRIGSSATLAMAAEQCKSLYGLKTDQVNIFPAPVLNWNDNYFSYVDLDEEGRRYVGVYANGSPSNKTTQYKLYASLLKSGAELVDNTKPNTEGYSTLVNYFNSIRDMGQALSLMGDDVPRELRSLYIQHEVPTSNQRTFVDINSGLVQMHGNVSSDKVQHYMQRLLSKYGEDQHVHTVLATNMISVGLDIPRLGLMAMIHQPKTMAEYIQASSRVGRGGSSGLIFVMLSSLRSRDRSHLEDFRTTHMKMYSLVEPSSLTPFSLSSMERALAGVLIAAFRNDPEFGLFEHFGPIDVKVKGLVRKFFEKRIELIDPTEKVAFIEKFEEICKQWNSGGFRSFGKEVHHARADKPLMVPFLTPCSSWSIKPFQVLQAMRNVDSGLELKQLVNE